VILSYADFNKISFDSLENCVNLESLGLKFGKGLELESINHYTTFRNLKMLELSLNEWSSKVTALIIEKAGNNLMSLTIGEESINHTINDDTLKALTIYCSQIESLSLSKISVKSYNILFSYIKDLKLNTLRICPVESKSKTKKIMKCKGLLGYIENQNSLSTYGTSKNFWIYDDDNNFKDLLKKRKIRLILYKPLLS